MLLIVAQSRRLGRFFVTLALVRPASRETCTSPSLVPAHSNPRWIGDSAMENTTPAYSTPMLSGVRPPDIFCRLLSLRVRSPLSSVHVRPLSVVTWTCWLPTYTRL